MKIIPRNFFITLFRLRSVTAGKGGPTGFPNRGDSNKVMKKKFSIILRKTLGRLPVSLSRQPDPVIKARVRNSGEEFDPMKILLSRRGFFISVPFREPMPGILSPRGYAARGREGPGVPCILVEGGVVVDWFF